MEKSNNKLNKYIESKLHPSEIEYLDNNLAKIINLIQLCRNNNKKIIMNILLYFYLQEKQDLKYLFYIN
jgi:hypothetical protein